MNKCVLKILLSVLLTLCLVGCGNTGTKNPAEVTKPAVNDLNSSEQTNDSKDDSKGDSKEEVKDDSKEDSNLSSNQSETSGSKILVAYFSRTGNTRPLAEYAAEYYSADFFEIEAATPYTDDDIKYYTDCRADREQNDPTARPEIAGSVAEMEKYDVIVLAYPIWHGQAPRIINTFLESYDFSGKTIIPFCTSASSGIGSSATNLHPLVSDTATWIDGKRFAAGTDKEELTKWLGSVYPINTSSEVNELRLYINDTEIPVIWEDNASVKEIMEEATKGEITVTMSKYSDFEQVGSLDKRYTSNDKQTTTHNGDIVLYSSNQIVVFYGSNSWAYTRLGKIDLPEAEVTELLSNGNVILKLCR